jgi:hypothetical protein
MNEKSILEQALLQVQTLEEAVKTNAKGILASTMKQEINDLLKEEEEEEEVVSKQSKPKKGGKDVTSNFDEDEETDDEEIEDEDSEDDEEIEDEDLEDDDEIEDDEDSEMDFNPDNEMGFNPDDEDSEMGGSNPFMGGQGSDMGNDEVFNATEASSEEVLRIFKAMGPEDGFIVKKEGNTVEFKDGDNEYIIKLNENEDSMYDDMYEDDDDVYEGDDEKYDDMYEKEDDMYEDDDDMYGENEDDVVYEIDLDGSDEYGDEEGDVQKLDATEAARTKWNAHGDKGGSNRLGIKGKKIFAAGAINEEMNKLKKQNSEYRKALVLFKEKLNEVAVFNANLAYSTRLFTEHSTTKKEKINILKRFDSVSTLKESKNLYSIIKTDLENKKPISESVVNRLNSTPSTSSSTQVLSESKAYENPQFRRMKDLMSKIK